ncbi:S8 family peptidase [Archangium sp.]|uniref:S8 family peptidase n=1 Tax=Archangium sp. TaxID=1872627 RepID=UPI002D6AF552|nr:S8 family peptidase [Archangium sp.]HYO59388.1 S8 family peptidase [Archangium sp.]
MSKSTRLSRRLVRHTLVGLALLSLPSAAEAAPKSLAPRAAAIKHTGRELPADTYVERLVVKFHEGSRVRLRGNALVALAAERGPAERGLLSARGLRDERVAADAAAVQSLLERAPRLGAIARLFEEDETSLEARKLSGEEQSGQQLADLNLYFEVPLLPGTTAGRVADLVASLNALEGVEVAYAEPPPEPAMVNFGMDVALRSVLAAVDIAPTTLLYEASQGYLNAAPGGIDARYAWTVGGGKGLNVKVVDIEGGWRTTHEDMPVLFTQIGTQYNDLGWRNHGTAVLGEIVSVANAYGTTGIANQAKAGVSSIGSQSAASAISSAASAAGLGGVILIELHSQGPSDGTACTCNTSQCNYIAMEYWQANYDAIAQATANGVVVVEAAGNGSANLDSSAYGSAFNRAVRDSGAIIVGASTATTRVPMCWTNYGSRVDVHGWGERVYSMGYGDLFGSSYGEDQYYTATFSGTSSASPIITGAAASAQGVALANGRRLTSRQMRGVLSTNGTPQASDSRNIGALPDLRKVLPKVIAGTY